MEVNIHNSKKKKKPKRTLLDSLSHLTSPNHVLRLNAGVEVLKHVNEMMQKDNGNSVELDRILKRLIRGTGAPRICSRKGHFSVLVAMFTLTSSRVTFARILEIIDQELGKTGNVSKGEAGDMLTGQILVYGALIHSGMLLKSCTIEEQGEVIRRMLKVSCQRSYLPFISYSFLIDLVKEVDLLTFKNMLLPAVLETVGIPLESHNLDTLHFLLVVRDRFPDVINKKFFKTYLGVKDIIHKSAFENCAKVLLAPSVPFQIMTTHPVFEQLTKQLIKSSLFPLFWKEGIEQNLLKVNTLKECVSLKLFGLALENIEDKNQICQLLTSKFLEIVIKHLKVSEKSSNELVKETHKVWNSLIKIFEKIENVEDETILDIIHKLQFYPGDFMFEKVTGTRTIQILSSKLSATGVKSLTDTYRDIVMCNSQKVTSEDGRTTPWLTVERVYAGDLLTRLICLPAVQDDVNWRVDNLKFLARCSMFQEDKIGHQLADSLLNGFFRVLDQKPKHQLPKLNSFLVVLDTVVHYIDSLLTSESALRKQWTPEVLSAWKKMIKKLTNFNSSKSSNLSIMQVFRAMFLHMGLQLIVEPKMALESLEELHACYDKWLSVSKSKRHKSNQSVAEDVDGEVEVQWVDVTVDLLLSMLSRNARVLRNVVGWVFPHLCPLLTPLALNNILTVLDPESSEAPLMNTLSPANEDDEDDESTDEEGNSNDSDDEEQSDISESDDDDIEDEEGTPANLELQMALREALGTSGAATDTESIDLDDISEEEGKKLDMALSNAFKMYKTTKKQNSRKQPRKDKALTHFRIRVLDLVEIYISMEPSLKFILEIVPPLFRLLEFCIVDTHQKPLETRLKTCLNKLSTLKKMEVDGVTSQQLGEALSSLLSKGEVASSVYADMVESITACCIFIMHASDNASVCSPKKKHKIKNDPVISVMKQSFEDYFEQKSSHLPASVFGSIIQQIWHGSWFLAALCISYAFNSNIRVFHRCRALYILKMFFEKQNRLTKELSDIDSAQLVELKKTIVDNTISLLSSSCNALSDSDNLKHKFVSELVEVLLLVRQSSNKPSSLQVSDELNWEQIGRALLIYKEKTSVKSRAKNVINKLLSQLNIRKSSKESKSDASIKEDSEMFTNDNEELVVPSIEVSTNHSEKTKRKRATDLRHEKKQAKVLRMSAMSEGLDSFSFSAMPFDSVEQSSEEIAVENSSIQNEKLNRRNKNKNQK